MKHNYCGFHNIAYYYGPLLLNNFLKIYGNGDNYYEN